MNSSTTHTIQIEGLPEGWEVKGVRIVDPSIILINPKHPGYRLSITDCMFECELIVQKTKPRKIVLEETEEMRQVHEGEYYFDPLLNKVVVWLGAYKKVSDHEYKIWRIKEE